MRKLHDSSRVEWMVDGAYGERREIDHRIAQACVDIAKGEVNDTKQYCSLGETCLLKVRMCTDDSGDMSSARVICEKNEAVCDTVVAVAAGRTESGINVLVSDVARRTEEVIATRTS